jgi:hypothetical protein
MRDVNDLNGCMSRNIILRRRKKNNTKISFFFARGKNNRSDIRLSIDFYYLVDRNDRCFQKTDGI